MKYFILLFLCLSSVSFSQVDNNGNPIFNSIAFAEDTLSTCILHSNYYTISNNIDNQNSSVFVNSNPTIEEIIKFSRELPSYFFIVSNNKIVSHMIMVLVKIEGKKSIYSFNILNPENGQQVELPSETKGDVTEVRAAELLKKYPDNSKELKMGPNSMIVFDKVAYSIQPFDKLTNEVIKLVDTYKLYKKDFDLKSINIE
jgi:hypothetical protein